jgi:hypothetical protein
MWYIYTYALTGLSNQQTIFSVDNKSGMVHSKLKYKHFPMVLFVTTHILLDFIFTYGTYKFAVAKLIMHKSHKLLFLAFC